MSNVQIRGCCCGIPFGCGSVFLLVGGLFLWKLATGALDGATGAASTALYAVLALAGLGLVLSVRVGRGRPDPPRAQPRPGDLDPL